MSRYLLIAGLVWFGFLATTVFQVFWMGRTLGVSPWWKTFSCFTGSNPKLSREIFKRSFLLDLERRVSGWKPREILLLPLTIPMRLWMLASILVTAATFFLLVVTLSPFARLYHKRSGRYVLESEKRRRARVVLDKFSSKLATSGGGTQQERTAQMLIQTLEILYKRLDDMEVIRLLYLGATDAGEMLPDEAVNVLREFSASRITLDEAKAKIRALINEYRNLFEELGFGPVQITALHPPSQSKHVN